VHAASFAPVGAWWLQLLSLGALAALVVRRAASHAACDTFACAAVPGLAFGLGWFATGVSWLYISMHRYGGMPAPVAALAVLLFAGYLALFVAAVTALTQRAVAAMLRRRHALSPLVVATTGALFAGAWGLAEIARGYLFTGFPWLAIGYAHVDGPLAALAPLVGVYGISALAALSAFGLGCALAAAGSVSALVPALVLALAPLAAGWTMRGLEWSQPVGRALEVRLLQGNVPQELKFDPARSLAAMQAYVAEVLRAEADLTVLPETAWTIPWSTTPVQLREAVLVHLARNDSVVAIGMPLPQQADAPRGTTAARITNSVATIDRRGALVSRYDKRHLVPFGEFIPRGFGWFVAMMEIPLGEFGRGAREQPPLVIDGQRVAFNICYEDLFGEELAVQVRGGATILVNLSNIAWFGASHALPQHLQIARMRARELARPMLRATNTGVTAAIDARGRVIDALPTHAGGVLAVSLRGSEGLTPYARHGNALPLALSLALALAGALGWLAMRGRAARTR
jgi:apolipoprotein N-acyltransferase